MQISVTITKEDKQIIQEAASRERESASNYLRKAALMRAGIIQ